MSVSSSTAGVHDALRDTLVVESVNLLHSDLVLEESRTGTLRVRGLQPVTGRKTRPRRIRRERFIPCFSIIEGHSVHSRHPTGGAVFLRVHSYSAEVE